MTQSHTPGPWSYFIHEGKDTNRVIGVKTSPGELETFKTICFFDCDNKTIDEVYKNARLIAASPIMLAALKRAAAEWWQTGSPVPDWLNNAIEQAESK